MDEIELIRMRARARAAAAAKAEEPQFHAGMPLSEAVAKARSTPAGAAVIGAGQGLTLGFGDEALGLAGGATDAMHGGDFSAGYDRERDNAREVLKKAEEEHPVAFGAGELIGGSALPLPGGNAKTIGGRMLKGALGAGGYGAGYGFGTGEGEADRMSRSAGGLGAGLLLGGAAVPLVEGATAIGRRYVMPGLRTVFNPADEAARRVGAAAEAPMPRADIPDRGLNPAEFDAAQNAGTPVLNLHRGGAQMERLADAANVASPEAGNILNPVLNDINATQYPRMSTFLDEMLPNNGSDAAREVLRNTARNSNRHMYTLANMHPRANGMWNEGYEQLAQSDIMQKAMRGALSSATNDAALRGFNAVKHPFSVQKNADGTERLLWSKPDVAPNLAYWDHVKRNLDDIIQKGTDITGKRTMEATQAIDLKNRLVSYLDDAVPAYKTARTNAGKYFGQETALDLGADLFNNAKKYSSDALRKAVGKWTPEERALVKIGYVDAMKGKLRGLKDVQDIPKQIFNSPATREAARAALGASDAGKIENMLRIESLMSRRRNAVQGNSKTMLRAIGQNLVAPFAVGSGASYLTGYSQSPWEEGAAAIAGHGLFKGGQHMLARRLAGHIAEILASNDPALYKKAITKMSDDPRLMGLLRLLERPMQVLAAQRGADSQ